MRPVGYVTDGEGRRIFALVPVAQMAAAGAVGGPPLSSPSDAGQAALDLLCTRPVSCLELGAQVNPIRSARESAGLTQADLAFAMRISQAMLSRQEQPFRRVRPSTVQRALETIRRIQENRNRPQVSLDAALSSYGARLAASAARKPRDPVERRLLRELGDPVALRENEDKVREGGERRRPPAGKVP